MKYSAGHNVIMTGNSNNHSYPIGSIVTLAYSHGSKSWKGQPQPGSAWAWYIMEKDFKSAATEPGEDCLF